MKEVTDDRGTLVVLAGGKLLARLIVAGILVMLMGAVLIPVTIAMLSDPKVPDLPLLFFAALTIGIAFMLTVILSLAYCVWLWLRHRPVFEVSVEGIRGNGTVWGINQFVPWSEITGLRRRLDTLVIDLAEPKAFLARCGSMRRIFLRTTAWEFGSPLRIPGGFLPISLDELTTLIERRRAVAALA